MIGIPSGWEEIAAWCAGSPKIPKYRTRWMVMIEWMGARTSIDPEYPHYDWRVEDQMSPLRRRCEYEEMKEAEEKTRCAALNSEFAMLGIPSGWEMRAAWWMFGWNGVIPFKSILTWMGRTDAHSYVLGRHDWRVVE